MPSVVRSSLFLAALAATCPLAGAQIVTSTPAGTAFTYQGRLEDNGQPVNGLVDLEFRLYTGPTQLNFVIGSPRSFDVDGHRHPAIRKRSHERLHRVSPARG